MPFDRSPASPGVHLHLQHEAASIDWVLYRWNTPASSWPFLLLVHTTDSTVECLACGVPVATAISCADHIAVQAALQQHF